MAEVVCRVFLMRSRVQWSMAFSVPNFGLSENGNAPQTQERTPNLCPLRRNTFGIVGGCGATGRAVVAELLKSSDAPVLIGGRDLGKLRLFTAELGRRVSFARVDASNAASLDEFCSGCSVIVNCAGPVMLLQDRVAQAAFRKHCHYVDAAGMGVVKERLLPHTQEIAAVGLSFVISAGWTPGLTEFVPVYGYARAKSRMDSIESLSAYSSDSGDWSANALRDGVAFIRRTGLAKPGYFRKGEWVRAKTSEASRRVDLGEDTCVRLLRNMFRRNRLAVAGFVEVRVVGRCDGRAATLKIRVTFEAGRDYWMNAVALATVARMVSARQSVQSGVHYLSAAMDAIAFMAELRKAGVQQTESFEFAE
jgi:hypothetical protein